MSDEHEWVRRMLADAGRSPEPMPPDVADRLDRVLDGLAADADGPDVTPVEAAEPAEGAVVAMTPSRHRRWAGGLLAAAALTVGGYSLTATGVLDGVTGQAESQSAADSAAGESLADEPPPDAPSEGGGEETSGADAARDPALQRDQRTSSAVELSSATLRRDAARLVGGSREAPSSLKSSVCVPPPSSVRGSRAAVTYDGRPATAVLRTTPQGRTDVQLWDCESPVRLARVVVP